MAITKEEYEVRKAIVMFLNNVKDGKITSVSEEEKNAVVKAFNEIIEMGVYPVFDSKRNRWKTIKKDVVPTKWAHGGNSFISSLFKS